MKNSRDLILGEVVNIAIIYHIPDSWIYLLNGYDFSVDHMIDENRELIVPCDVILILRVPQNPPFDIFYAPVKKTLQEIFILKTIRS